MINRKQKGVLRLAAGLSAACAAAAMFSGKLFCGADNTIFFDGYDPASGVGWVKPMRCDWFWSIGLWCLAALMLLVSGVAVYFLRDKEKTKG